MQSFSAEDFLRQAPSRRSPSTVVLASEPRVFNETNQLSYLETSLYAGGDATLNLHRSRESLDALHDQFHDVLEFYKDKQFSFHIMKEFTNICQCFLQSQPGGSDIERWLWNEKNTWNLLQILMQDHFCHTAAEELVAEELDYPVSEKEVMEEVFQKDSITRQCQLVVDWLEACEADKRLHQLTVSAEHFSDKTMLWENTILQLVQKDNIPYLDKAAIVKEIDPDAPVRQQLPIHKLDGEDENLMLSQVLSHIRCGQLQQAQKLCSHCGQPWRAATLEGWRLFHDPNMSHQGEQDKLEPTEGNPNRDIWKVAAWRLAEDRRMPLQTRTLYAVLCGHLEVMLLNMATWHDWLWAHLKAMIDVRIEEEVRLKCTRLYTEMPMKYWSNKMNLSQIFSSLAASPQVQVRTEHTKEIITVQRLLILNDMTTLFASLSQWARQVCDYQNPMSALLIRFAAHLVLVLRAMGKEENETCVKHGNEVLAVYTKCVISMGNANLIMSYIAKLPRCDQVATLAQYLETVLDPTKKAECLELAARQGLDAESAAHRVVESIRARQHKGVGELLRGETTQEDLDKIDALDWLVVYPSQYMDALWQANALARNFIAGGKLDAARAVFDKLPPGTLNAVLQENVAEFVNVEDLDATMSPRDRSAVREYLSLKLYLDAQEDFSRWFKTFHQQQPSKVPPLPKDATFQQKLVHEEQRKYYQLKVADWKKDMSRYAKDCRTRLFSILTFPAGGWLGCRLDLNDEDNATRKRELEALCTLCIPEAALLIHEVSMKSGEPQQCMLLADVLASERYELTAFFSKEKAREILSKITDACMEHLKEKKDPWGYPVTS